MKTNRKSEDIYDRWSRSCAADPEELGFDVATGEDLGDGNRRVGGNLTKWPSGWVGEHYEVIRDDRGSKRRKK